METVRTVAAIALGVGLLALIGCCRPWYTSDPEPLPPVSNSQYDGGPQYGPAPQYQPAPYSNSYAPRSPQTYQQAPYGASRSKSYGQAPYPYSTR
jgi:hypothetical protein